MLPLCRVIRRGSVSRKQLVRLGTSWKIRQDGCGNGYRRLAFMMLDADIVAVSPTSVWRVLGQAGLLSKWNGKPSKKAGFEQPLAAH